MEMIIVIAGLAAVCWGAVIFLRGGLLAGALTVLLAGICCGYEVFHAAVGPLTVTTDRILWCILIAQYAVWRRLGRFEAKPPGKEQAVMAALIGVLLVSMLGHDWQAHHFMPLARLVFYYLMPAGMYWVAWQMPLTERGMRNMFAGLALLGVYLALTAIAERFAFSGLVFPQYIASPATPEFLGRARGPLLNPSAEGILLGLCLGGALMSWPGMNRWGRLGLVGLAALMMTGIYCTLTRSAWMGGMAGMLLVVLLGAPRRWRGRLLAGALVLAAAVLATSWQQILEFKRDRNLSAAETAESVRLRPILAAAAWKMFLDRPISGCGFGQYDRQLPNYLGDRTLDVPLEKARKYVQHNVWLSLLTETGLTGATLFVLLTIVWIHNAWGLWTSDAPLWARQQGLLLLVLLANYFSNGMFQDVSIMPMIHMVVFFLAGLTANLHWRMRRGFWEYQSRTRAAQFQALAGHPADLVAT